jgi:molybdenum cofactor cytidylyltransferase
VTPTRLEAIVLAAGEGRRFGGGKLMAPWRGGALIDGALGAALAAPVQRVIVVTGADLTVAEHVRKRADARLALVHAANHAEGMAASLRAGVTALDADASGAFVFLGDMPLVPHTIATCLANALAAGAPAAAPACEGRRGHPALISAALFPRLAALTGDVGARSVLDSLGRRLALVETNDPGVLADVDQPDDLKL